MVEIHAYHGWGFNGSFWDDLGSEIPKEILFKAADRGYFGGEFEPEFSEVSTTKIIFAHSFGLHWCPQEKLKNTDVLIIFNGFGDFLPSDFFERRKELKILKRMHDQFKKAPESILNAFLENCFHPQRTDLSTPKWMNRSLLARDLIALRKTKFIIEKLDIKTISLTGSEDQIVSIKRTEELVKQIGAIESGIIDGSGHALPIVNSSDCWSYLIEVVPIFAEYANKNGFK